ncbi:hypothetical protein COLO4_05194 [Corchorus olitorius]|uniref:Uncharacterized protein n=1 Tax=Corchorus olitorius TaxID=93759 RepID=A0A1R3KRL7_9ROSI|nr:hypothetical protein COLO4_05194 [Corchorus olitorius]
MLRIASYPNQGYGDPISKSGRWAAKGAWKGMSFGSDEGFEEVKK